MQIRVYVNDKIEKGHYVILKDNNLHHIKNVLKLSVGDCIYVFNQGYGEWEGKLIFMNKKEIKIELIKKVRECKKKTSTLKIFCPIIKKDNFYTVIQQATEMGVDEIVPFTSARTNNTIVTNHSINEEKVYARMKSAIEQCNRISMPILHKPITLSEILKTESNVLVGMEIMAREEGKIILQRMDVDKNINNISVMIGPEGGFAKEEAELIKQKEGFHCISIGENILRTETAAVAILQISKLILSGYIKL